MKLKYISWIPAFIIMCLIFNFSSKTAAESDGSSLRIANVLLDLYEDMNGKPLDMDQKEAILAQINHVIRKLAHGFEYMVLSLCVAFHLGVCSTEWRRLLLLSVLVSGFYAATDELHQLYVTGRSGRLSDVLIDTAGAAVGAALYLLAVKCIRKSSHTN